MSSESEGGPAREGRGGIVGTAVLMLVHAEDIRMIYRNILVWRPQEKSVYVADSAAAGLELEVLRI